MVASPAHEEGAAWGLPRAAWALAAAAALAAVLHTSLPLAGLPARAENAVVNGAQLAAALGAALAAGVAAARSSGRRRAAWALLAAGAGAWSVGQAAWTYYEVVMQVASPIPSLADAGYLSFYPLSAAGLLLFPAARPRDVVGPFGTALHGLLVAGVAFLVAWPFLLHEALHRAGDPVAGWLSVAYVIADIVVGSLALTSARRAVGRDRAVLALAVAAFAGLAVADAGLAAGVTTAGYETGAVTDAGWLVGFLLLAAAALASPRVAQTLQPTGAVEHFLPVGVLAVSIASLAAARLTGRFDDPDSALVAGGVFIAIAVSAVARQLAQVREHTRLAEESARLARALREERDASELARERLAETQRLARMASWEMDLATGRASWSNGFAGMLAPQGAKATSDLRGLLGLMGPALSRSVRRDIPRLVVGQPGGEEEVEVKRSDGSSIWVTVRSSPVTDAAGELVAIRGSIQDVTERREAAAMREAEAALVKALFDAVPAAVLVADARGRVQRWNREACIELASSDEALAGKSFVNLFAPDAAPRAAKGFDDGLQGGSALFEAPLARPDGSTREALVSVRRYEKAGEPLVVAIVLDVTDKRRSEAALARSERLASLGTLVAGVAHEINNPLAFIRSSVEFIDQEASALASAEPRNAKSVETIRHDAKTALAGLERIRLIARGLRQVARPSGGPRAPESVDALVQAILPVASPRVGPNVRVTTRLASARPVECSAAEISQVLLNLLLNAADATSAGTGEITVTTRDNERFVEVEVADTGPGIPSEKQALVFTPFFTTKPHGTGLGLSVSRSIALDHGGDLTFDSVPGAGTTFRLRLPAIQAKVD